MAEMDKLLLALTACTTASKFGGRHPNVQPK